MTDQRDDGPEILIEAPGDELDDRAEERLRAELAACPDVAFAHLCRVTVAGHEPVAQPSLFVWLEPESVGSLRAALNLVAEAVARALPEDRCLDVLILNSVPELLEPVEADGRLVVERDPEERRRAADAARSPGPGPEPSPRRLWPW